MIKRQKVYLVAVILYASFIFYLSSISNPPNPISYGMMVQFYHFLSRAGLGFLAYPFYLYILYPDKFIHFFLYLGFGILLNLSARSFTDGTAAYLIAIALGGAYAASDEVHQIFTPFRTASVSDFFADFLGILTAQLLALSIRRISRFVRFKGKNRS